MLSPYDSNHIYIMNYFTERTYGYGFVANLVLFKNVWCIFPFYISLVIWLKKEYIHWSLVQASTAIKHLPTRQWLQTKFLQNPWSDYYENCLTTQKMISKWHHLHARQLQMNFYQNSWTGSWEKCVARICEQTRNVKLKNSFQFLKSDKIFSPCWNEYTTSLYPLISEKAKLKLLCFKNKLHG